MKPVNGILPWLVPVPEKHHKRAKAIYGKRDTLCVKCKKLFRSSDVQEDGWCLWCLWDKEQASTPDIVLSSSSHKDVTAPIV